MASRPGCGSRQGAFRLGETEGAKVTIGKGKRERNGETTKRQSEVEQEEHPSRGYSPFFGSHGRTHSVVS